MTRRGLIGSAAAAVLLTFGRYLSPSGGAEMLEKEAGDWRLETGDAGPPTLHAYVLSWPWRPGDSARHADLWCDPVQGAWMTCRVAKDAASAIAEARSSAPELSERMIFAASLPFAVGPPAALSETLSDAGWWTGNAEWLIDRPPVVRPDGVTSVLTGRGPVIQ